MKVIGVRFKSSGRIYYFDPLEFEFREGDGVIVETARGQEFGEVAQIAMDVEETAIVSPLKPVVRPASDTDTTMREQNCAKEGDAVAKELVDRFVDLMGQFFANVGNSFGIKLIVVGGGISKEGQWLADRLREIVVREMYVGERFAPAIAMATLGNDAGVIGAAMLEQYQ